MRGELEPSPRLCAHLQDKSPEEIYRLTLLMLDWGLIAKLVRYMQDNYPEELKALHAERRAEEKALEALEAQRQDV